MKRLFTGCLFWGLAVLSAEAQDKCLSASWLQQQIAEDPSLPLRLEQIEHFTRNSLTVNQPAIRSNAVPQVIRIPVVVHVVYHLPGENISDQNILEQIKILNRDFRKKNSDTALTPIYYKSLSADFEIEFQLAKSDPLGRSTTGIVRKYSPVKYWESDDKVKFAGETGSAAWDTKNYLNIWICNLRDAMGYSAFPGTEASRDGIVLDYKTLESIHASSYAKGRTAVHEAGHWLNLKHIWGDAYCGDDNVHDTPKQSNYTPGCPGNVRLTCGNTEFGDMYMNYMDFTSDACVNMFTKGQKQRARVLFGPGGARHSILSSKGLEDPVMVSGPLPDFYPKWMYANLYPNPARTQLNVYFEYDERWVGNELQVLDVNGKVIMKRKITSANFQLDVSRLMPGIYFIRAVKEDESIFQKFIKM